MSFLITLNSNYTTISHMLHLIHQKIYARLVICQKLSTDVFGNVIFEVNKGIAIKLEFLIDLIASVVEDSIEHNLIEAS